MTFRRCGRMAGSAAAGVGSGAAHARPRPCAAGAGAPPWPRAACPPPPGAAAQRPLCPGAAATLMPFRLETPRNKDRKFSYFGSCSLQESGGFIGPLEGEVFFSSNREN